jgi:hypothetical protein
MEKLTATFGTPEVLGVELEFLWQPTTIPKRKRDSKKDFFK